MNVSRRYILKSAFAASAGLVLAACGGGSASTPAGSSPAAGSAAGSGAASRTAAASPAGSPSASGGAASAVAGTWDDLLAAAKKEGKVVVSGPPDPDSRAKLPPAFKARFGIDVEYLGGNSSQLAARIESERAANQYSMDVSISGSDSMMETFYKNKWIEPWKSSVLLPETADASKWRSGGPWFRDPNQDTILQVFNTVQPMITINLANVSPKDLPNADALLDPRWKGKICAYDPSVNGAGLAIGCAAYVAKGQDYVTKLYKGQNVTLSRDYQQVADWVAQGSYPIALATQLNYLDKYIKAGVKIAQSGSTDLAEFPDAGSALGGGFGDIGVWNKAPHPNAARVFANWIASKEGMEVFAPTQAQIPVRNDVPATWLPDYLVPKPGVKYLDTYDYTFETTQRIAIRDFFDKLLK